MSEDQHPFEKAKNTVMNLIPDTISGLLLVILFGATRLSESGRNTLIDVVRTGGHILFLMAMYFVGYSVRYVVNRVLSRVNPEKRMDEHE